MMAEVNLVSNVVFCSKTNFRIGLIKFVANDFHQVFGKHTPFSIQKAIISHANVCNFAGKCSFYFLYPQKSTKSVRFMHITPC